MSPELQDLCQRMGVELAYRDTAEIVRETSEETARALLTALGAPAVNDADVRAALTALKRVEASRLLPEYLIAQTDLPTDLEGLAGRDWVLTLEDGREIEGRGRELPATPLGIHSLTAADNHCWLISAPPTIPAGQKSWGVMLPLYGLGAGPFGSYRNLADYGAALTEEGAGFVGINPVHAGFFPHTTEISPYAPSHRRRFNAAHVDLAPSARSTASGLIDYASGYRARWSDLEAAFASAGVAPDYAAFEAEGGDDLLYFAIHQAISEVYGPYWTGWPEALQDVSSKAVEAFADAYVERVRFHSWLQWQAEQQLLEASQRTAAMAYGLYLDVAVGVHPAGAETWLERDLFGRGITLGAPPDAFSAEGQNWGLAPFNPVALIRQGFRPLAEMLRQQFRFCRLLRIDHILGFERSFWVPETGERGGYVRMPRDAMLAVARIEAVRAGGTIVGEDLGNVPDGLRNELANSGLLGCRVALFERDETGRPRAAEAYPEPVLASFGTHDLPTYAGWRKGCDIEVRHDLGLANAGDRAADLKERADDVADLDAAMKGRDMTEHLAASHARLVGIQIEDILGLEDQPNLPGTVDTYPNWRRRVPVSATDLQKATGLRDMAEKMARAGR